LTSLHAGDKSPVQKKERTRLAQPYQCRKCGTIYAAGSVGGQPPAISACTVCGEELLQRNSARDPLPSTKGDFWLWLGAFGEAGWLAVLAGALVFAALGKLL